MTESEKLLAECERTAKDCIMLTTDLTTVERLCLLLGKVCREYQLAVASALRADERSHEMIKERECYTRASKILIR